MADAYLVVDWNKLS